MLSLKNNKPEISLQGCLTNPVLLENFMNSKHFSKTLSQEFVISAQNTITKFKRWKIVQF